MARPTPLLGHDEPFGSMLGMTPFNDVRFGLLGESIVDANALLRAYIWHCVAIPIIASTFMEVHFCRVRNDGGISCAALVMPESEIKDVKKISSRYGSTSTLEKHQLFRPHSHAAAHDSG